MNSLNQENKSDLDFEEDPYLNTPDNDYQENSVFKALTNEIYMIQQNIEKINEKINAFGETNIKEYFYEKKVNQKRL